MDEEVFYLEDMEPGDDGEVSPVTAGANQGAHILLLKTRDSRSSHRDTLPGNSPKGGRESSVAPKEEILLKLGPVQKHQMIQAAIDGAKAQLAHLDDKADDDPPKGQAGDMTGGRARDRLRNLQSNGMSLQEISDQLDRIGESASRSPSVLGAILAGEIMNPPDDLLGFLRRVKPTEEDREEASMSKNRNQPPGSKQELLLKLDPEQKVEFEKYVKDAVAAATAPLQMKVGHLEEENARFTEDHEKAAALKVFAAETLPPAMQEAFASMTPEEQEAFKLQFEAAAEGGADPMAKFAKAHQVLADQNKELATNLQKMRDEQDQSAAVAKFQDLSHVVKVDDFARSYRKMHAAAPEEADAWVEKIRALASQEKTGKVFSILGGDGDGHGETARQKIEKGIKAIIDVNPKIKRHEAQEMVLKADSDLYDQYKAERSA